MEKDHAVRLEVIEHPNSPKLWTQFVQTCEHTPITAESNIMLPYTTIPRTRVTFESINVEKYYATHSPTKPHKNVL